MARFPGPVHSDKADEAEARLNRLHSRFAKVSARLDGRSRKAGGWGVTPLEIVIGLGLAGFVVWAVLQVV